MVGTLLLIALLFVSLPVLAQSGTAGAGAEKKSMETINAVEKPSEANAKSDTREDDSADEQVNEYYFLTEQGKGMPVKQIVLNGVNVLGGSIISLALPINVTRQIKQGLNQLKVQFVSDHSEGLITIMEKRTAGPKKVEVARLAIGPGESKGQELVKELAFNVDPAPVPPAKIDLTQTDENEIFKLVSEYYEALKAKNASKLRALYGPALKIEERIYPEGARFFTKVLNKEISLLRREDIRMEEFNIEDVMLEQEDDKIKVLRKDRKPMMQSNEIELAVEPIMAEIKEEGNNKSKKLKKKDSLTVKQRLVTTKLLFRKLDGKWCIALPQGV